MSQKNYQKPQLNVTKLLSDLPGFMRAPYPNVKFNSAFPPFTTNVPFRGVMERAGFDVYKPDRNAEHRHSGRSKHGSSSRMVSDSGLLSPNPLYGRKGRENYSDPSIRHTTSESRAVSEKSNPLGSQSNPSLFRMGGRYAPQHSGSQIVPEDQSGANQRQNSLADHLEAGQPLHVAGTLDPGHRDQGSLHDVMAPPSRGTLRPRFASVGSERGPSTGSMAGNAVENAAPIPMQDVVSPALSTRSNPAGFSVPRDGTSASIDGSMQSNPAPSLPGINQKMMRVIQNQRTAQNAPVVQKASRPADYAAGLSFDRSSETVPGGDVDYSEIEGGKPTAAFEKESPFKDSDDEDESEYEVKNDVESDVESEYDVKDSVESPATVQGGEKFAGHQQEEQHEKHTGKQKEDGENGGDADSMDSFDAQFEPERDSSVNQLLHMQREVSGGVVGTNVNEQFGIPDIKIGGEAIDDRESSDGSMYGDSEFKRISTMQTDDPKIYNLPKDEDEEEDESEKSDEESDESANNFDMTTIQEQEEADDTHTEESSPISAPSSADTSPLQDLGVPGLTKMKVNALSSPNESPKLSGAAVGVLGPATAPKMHKHSLSQSSVSSRLSAVHGVGEADSSGRTSGDLDGGKAAWNDGDGGAERAGEKQQEKQKAEEEQEVKYPPGQGPCRKCHQPILKGQKSIWSKDSQLSGQWHRRCFSCYACSQKFTKGQSCYVYNDRPYCETHFHEMNGSLCRICGKGVEGECLQNEVNEVFHTSCLKCCVCDAAIRTEYFIYCGKVLCEKDANEQIKLIKASSGGLSTNDKVVKRRTRLMHV